MMATEEFRSDVAGWFATHTPEGWRERIASLSPEEYVEFVRSWVRTLAERGFSAPSVAPEWGGGGYSFREQAVIHDEWAKADAPGVDLFIVSLHHVPATFLAAGTAAQRERYVRDAVTGTIWCQGFSEPEAGSDLGSLRTRADRVEGGWSVSGLKTWSTNADKACWCLLLARTDPDSHGGRGITYFVLDMNAPGVEVRPIRQNTGHPEFCEIALTGVFIPDENVVGEVGRGWAVAQETLSAERGPAGFDVVARLGARLDDILVRADPADALLADRLAGLDARWHTVRSLALDLIDLTERGADTGRMTPALKVAQSELLQEITDFGSRWEGTDGLVRPLQPHPLGYVTGDWPTDWIGSWSWTIAGGSNEIQRTIIAEKVLGLPREPRPARSETRGST